ncbi:MAG: SoxR reducing system RseC family protein [Prevotella sp.]
MQKKIRHTGTIVETDGKHAIVRIVRTSACATCEVSAACKRTETDTVLVDVYGTTVHGRKAGEQVVVEADARMGAVAVLLAFVLPLVAFVVSIALAMLFTANEVHAALAGLGVMAVYFLTIFGFRHRIDRRFTFTLRTQ